MLMYIYFFKTSHLCTYHSLEKIIVENIYVKIIHCKIVLSLLASDENFTVKFFTIEFFQFKLGAISPVVVGQKAVTH